MKLFYYRGVLGYLRSFENGSFFNERAIEVPAAKRFLTSNTLEIGNVLHRYCDHTHRVIDLYEKAPGVINEDALAHVGHYDSVVSISTIEHIGYDDLRGRELAIAAINRIPKLLNPNGVAFLTVPLGYNQWLDDKLEQPGWEVDYYKRVSWLNTWANGRGLGYSERYPNANTVAFMYYHNG